MSQGLCLSTLGLWLSKLLPEMILSRETNLFIHAFNKHFLSMAGHCAGPWQDSDKQDRPGP